MTQWINFPVLKGQVSFSTVLSHYRIDHLPSAAKATVLCPFHDDTDPSLSVNFEDKLFHCFSCDVGGDILTFVAKMEQVSLPEAARIMSDLCGIPLSSENVDTESTVKPTDDQGVRMGNKPLSFSLDLDPTHPYLTGRGLLPEAITYFELGFCARGLMNGRIGIPIHDEAGDLVAYAGRWVGDVVPDGVSKYLLPSGFKKNEVLFNLHRVASADHVVVVEGYWSVFRLHALGFAAVALMGRTLSEAQEELLVCSGARFLTLLLDGDKPGREAADEMLPRLSRNCFVFRAELPDGEQPDTVDAVELNRLLWMSQLG